jgi:hypothetical protein
MPHILQRHGRSLALVAVLVVGSFLYLNAPYPTYEYTANVVGFPGDSSLPARVERAEQTYKKVVEKRQQLIKKHGPSSSQIVMHVLISLSSLLKLILAQVPTRPRPLACIHRL